MFRWARLYVAVFVTSCTRLEQRVPNSPGPMGSLEVPPPSIDVAHHEKSEKTPSKVQRSSIIAWLLHSPFCGLTFSLPYGERVTADLLPRVCLRSDPEHAPERAR